MLPINCTMWKVSLLLKAILVISVYVVPGVFLTDPETPNEIVVQIGQGPVRGFQVPHRHYYSFLGIPYGTVNATNRFQEAYPPPIWNKIRDPIKVTCPQGLEIISEDCLVVNVYIPIKIDHLLPVIVDIHGGAFQMGHPHVGPEFLIKHGVIVVTITYRLGIFGFLCAGTEDIPGNAGMKDQVMALRWIRDNISLFGGNPNLVTITGGSAGGSSVDLHVVSPMSNGLFHRAMARSGSAMSFWAMHRNGTAFAVEIANVLGFNVSSLQELNTVLTNTTQRDLQHASVELIDLNSSFFFTPCVEKGFSPKEKFLSESPYKILTSGRQNSVPLIIGFNEREGIYFLRSNSFFETFEETFSKYIPKDLNIPEEDKPNILNSIKQFYFGNNSITKDMMNEYIDLRTDSIFLWPIYWRILLQREKSKSKIFLFEFFYDGKLCAGKIHSKLTQIQGASHGDDRGYMFNTGNVDLADYSQDDVNMVDIMSTFLTDFAKYGDPTPKEIRDLPLKWKSVKAAGDINYMRIGFPMRNAVNPYPKRMALWQRLYEEYYMDVLEDDPENRIVQ